MSPLLCWSLAGFRGILTACASATTLRISLAVCASAASSFLGVLAAYWPITVFFRDALPAC